MQHFVTPLVQGLRYGFFFVTMPRTRMAALRIHRFWRDACYNPVYAYARKQMPLYNLLYEIYI